ncbi:MAG: hypothetical protein AAGF87_02695 [Bacteroidota bacterium]
MAKSPMPYPPTLTSKEIEQIENSRTREHLKIRHELEKDWLVLEKATENYLEKTGDIIGGRIKKAIGQIQQKYVERLARLQRPKGQAHISAFNEQTLEWKRFAQKEADKVFKNNKIDLQLLQASFNEFVAQLPVYQGIGAQVFDIDHTQTAHSSSYKPEDYLFLADHFHGRGFGGPRRPFKRNDIRQYLFNGGVKNYEYLYNHNAGNFDTAYLWDFQGFSCFYRMPHAGRLQLILKVQAGENYHRITLNPELGWTSGYSRQLNGISAKFHSSEILGHTEDSSSTFKVMSTARVRSSQNFLGADEQPYALGTEIELRFLSDQVFPENAQVAIDFGLVNFIRCVANDLKIDSRILSTWHFEEAIVSPVEP